MMGRFLEDAAIHFSPAGRAVNSLLVVTTIRFLSRIAGSFFPVYSDFAPCACERNLIVRQWSHVGHF